MGARYYDRNDHFTQPDSIEGNTQNPHTLNHYAYAASDPINNTDPTGRDFGDALGAAFGVTGAAGAFEGLAGSLEAIGEATGAVALGIGIGAGISATLAVGGLALGGYFAYESTQNWHPVAKNPNRLHNRALGRSGVRCIVSCC